MLRLVVASESLRQPFSSIGGFTHYLRLQIGSGSNSRVSCLSNPTSHCIALGKGVADRLPAADKHGALVQQAGFVDIAEALKARAGEIGITKKARVSSTPLTAGVHGRDRNLPRSSYNQSNRQLCPSWQRAGNGVKHKCRASKRDPV